LDCTHPLTVLDGADVRVGVDPSAMPADRGREPRGIEEDGTRLARKRGTACQPARRAVLEVPRTPARSRRPARFEDGARRSRAEAEVAVHAFEIARDALFSKIASMRSMAAVWLSAATRAPSPPCMRSISV
jgi:hypothetical protein